MKKFFKLRHEESIDFARWAKIINYGFCFCLSSVFIAEVIVVCSLYGFPGDQNMFFWKNFVVIPGISYLVLLVVTLSAFRFLREREKFAAMAYVVVTMASILCFIVSYTHYDDSAIYAIYVFPFLAALFFIDLKPLVLTYLETITCYLVIVLIVLPNRTEKYVQIAEQGITEIVTIIIFLTACFVVSITVLIILSNLTENIILQNHLLKIDPFTELLNHTSFYDKLHEMVNDETRNPSLIIWDIDDFKKINDRHGHEMGDKVIWEFAESMRYVLGRKDLGFRYGGEEFGALTWKNCDDAVRMADNVRIEFTKRVKALLIKETVTACAGVGSYSKDYFADEQVFFSAVDEALYCGKRTDGKNTVVRWTPEVRGQFKARRKDDRII